MAKYRIKREIRVTVYDYLEAENEQVLEQKIDDMDSLIGEISHKAKLSDSHDSAKYDRFDYSYIKVEE